MNRRFLLLALALFIVAYQTIFQRAFDAEHDVRSQFCTWNDAVVLGSVKDTDLVTFATHASVQYLRNLKELIHYWSAPISVAVYVHNAQHVSAVVQILRTLTVDNAFTATIFWRREDARDSCAVRMSIDDCNDWQCLPTENDIDLTYPVNTARNIARAHVQTPYELVADVELQPASVDFTHRLQEFLRNTETSPTTVHVVPVFEYNTTIQAPTSKPELLKAIHSHNAVFFHHLKAPKCHRIPDAIKWLQRPDNGAVNIFTTTRWLQPCWEPVYVARAHETPLYNESFVGYGKNKIQQVYEMCRANYTFNILDSVYLLHKNIAIMRASHYQRIYSVLMANARRYEEFIRLLDSRYTDERTKLYCNVGFALDDEFRSTVFAKPTLYSNTL